MEKSNWIELFAFCMAGLVIAESIYSLHTLPDRLPSSRLITDPLIGLIVGFSSYHMMFILKLKKRVNYLEKKIQDGTTLSRSR